jgi:hypothetical protein
MNINNQLGLMTHPIPAYNKSLDQQLGFIGSDGQGMLFNADGGEYWASKSQPNTSDDTLLMLNEDNYFLNADSGDKGNAKVDKDTYTSTTTTQRRLTELKEGLLKNTITLVNGQQPIKFSDKGELTSLNKYLYELGRLKDDEDKNVRNYQAQLQNRENNVTQLGQKIRTSKEYRKRKDLNEALWYSDNAVKAITDEITLVTQEIKSATEKIDNDAFAKAKSSNTIVAYTEYIKNFPSGLSVEKATKAIDDIKKAQTLKELEEKKKTATPEEKKQIDAEINNLLGNVTTQLKGTGGKILLYGGAGLVVIFVLYKILGTKKATN